MVDIFSVQGETDVLDSLGEKVGGIGGIGTDRSTDPPTHYLVVKQGILGMAGGTTLYVPESDLAQAQLGHDVRLKVSKAEAEDLYKTRPHIL